MTSVKFEQLPAEVNIEVGAGDDLSMLLDFDINLTGYTFVCKVVKSDLTEVAFTTANTDLANGQVTISLTDTQMGTIGATDIHTWYFAWTVSGNTRRVLAGTFRAKAKRP